MSANQTPDLQVYETAHKVVEADTAAEQTERRSSARHSYAVIQRITPYDREVPLPELTFFPVWCRDISRGGISFLLPDKIDCSSVVVELGTPPDTRYVEAAVTNCRSVWYTPAGEVKGRASEIPPSGGGLPMQMIGCRFTGRVLQ